MLKFDEPNLKSYSDEFPYLSKCTLWHESRCNREPLSHKYFADFWVRLRHCFPIFFGEKTFFFVNETIIKDMIQIPLS